MTHVVIIGAGAIGGALGAYLHRAERHVTLVDPWFRHVEQIRRDGLRVESPEETFTTHPRALHVDELELLDEPADVLVIATKAYDTEWAFRLMAPYLDDDAPVLCAQNGIMEELAPRFIEVERIVGCVVSMAAEIFDPGVVRRTLTGGWPTLTLGDLTPTNDSRVRRLQELFAPTGEIATSDDIVADLWSKLALNAMTNGVGALTGATTRIIWGDERFLPVTVAACAETAKVASEAGVAMKPVFGRIPLPALLAAHDGDTASADDVARILRDIAEQRTGARENKPSMLQDHMKARRTEIDYINGHVVRHGERLGVRTPVNTSILNFVHRLQLGDVHQDRDHVDELRDAALTD